MNRLQFVLSVFCVSLFCALGCAQNNSEKKNYLFFDKVVGIENSDLHYGNIYEEEHRVKSKKTKFFPQPDFVLGSVVFNEQPYFDILIKYNVYDDELLMLADKRFGGNILQLHKKLLNGFEIDNNLFIKIDNEEIPIGFYEVVMEKPLFSLFAKHRKILKQLLGEKQVFYEFIDDEKHYFLLYQNTYHYIERFKDLISIFPKYDAELKSYNENLGSSLPFYSRLESLLEYLDTLLSGENDKMRGN